ncbi:MAG: DUF503 domain-containing protein [bacterium]|nr:DUF503 domain-containing protein [bacterium]
MNKKNGFLAAIRIDIHFPYVQSLKEKRSLINSLKDKIRTKTNVSIIELGSQEVWQTANLYIATVANEPFHAEQTIQECLRLIESKPDCIITNASVQWY